MIRDLFAYIKDLGVQDYYLALGSRQQVRVKRRLQKKASKAYDLCVAVIEGDGQTYRNDRWRKVFGRVFPARPGELKKAFITEAGASARDTEEVVEDKYPIDIRYNLKINCNISQNGFRERLLREWLRLKLPLQPRKSLDFFVESHDLPGAFVLYWKVLNRGPEAVRRDNVRGQIVPDAGQLAKSERTTFRGTTLSRPTPFRMA